MASGDGLGLALIFTTLAGAIGWLAKRLYDAPRPEDYKAVVEDRNTLRKLVDDATEKARAISDERELENKKLREELAELKNTVKQQTTGGRYAPVPEKDRRVQPYGRRAGDRRGDLEDRRNAQPRTKRASRVGGDSR